MQLKDIANNVLPFVILRSNLAELKVQIENEHKAQVGTNVINAIDTPEMKEIISNVLDNCGIELADDVSKKLIFEIIDYAKRGIELTGIKPTETSIRGGTDGSTLTEMGLPCPNLGTGAVNFHTPKEFVSVDEMKLCCEN